jgi:hypothetical protein
MFLLLATGGTAVRLVTQFAYRPAILGMPDSAQYLETAAHLEPAFRPIAYSVLLRVLPLGNGLWVVPFVQRLMGLLMAVLVYIVLLRLGVRRWLGALVGCTGPARRLPTRPRTVHPLGHTLQPLPGRRLRCSPFGGPPQG